MHRVLTVETWVNRLIKLAPIDSIAMELVSFDTHKMVNPEVSGAPVSTWRISRIRSQGILA